MSGDKISMIATSTMGLESLVARELKQLGLDSRNSDVSVGRTFFSGTFTDMIRANIHLRTAGKILIQLDQFRVFDDFEPIIDSVENIPWEDWMPSDARIIVEGRSVRSTITSTPALQRTVKKGIVNRLMKAYRCRTLPEDGPEYTVEISLLKDVATITLDTTGRSLHRRGYRLMNVPVPLKETLASALVQLSVWTPERPLLDPFCASGTIPIEAAMIARNIAPGLKRQFAAQYWPVIPSSLWQEVRREARAAIRPSMEDKIIGSDIDAEALKHARYHAQLAGVSDDILFEERDFYKISSDREYGCIICNPPYGDRVGEHEQFRALYESIPAVLSRFPTWSHFIITSWNELESVLGQQADRRRKLYNGPIECTYFQFLGPRPPRKQKNFSQNAQKSENQYSQNTQIANNSEPFKSKEYSEQLEYSEYPDNQKYPVSPEAAEYLADTEKKSDISAEPFEKETKTALGQNKAPVFGGLDEYSEHQIQEFGRCLQNRAKHLSRFPKRGITCYRLYDRDFPEVPLAIDIFEGSSLHIAEYERPDNRTAGQHRLWLDKIVEKASEILKIEPVNVFLKRRKQQKGKNQYEKLNESGKMISVQEGGLSFLCNMTDYLDVGLFLDHRPTRAMVRKESQNKRFLNLFCYTGSFTCYAAAGGADSAVSVDLSSTYLDWAEANMEQNGFYDRSRGGKNDFQYIRSDVFDYLNNLMPAARSDNGGLPDDRGHQTQVQKWRTPHQNISDFDLCVCDPPTFSNSKSTERDWDVQRCHVDLLRLLASRMQVGGIVYFSNNFQRFKLDEESLSDLYFIREISKQSVAEEFRNRRIHRCWRLKVLK